MQEANDRKHKIIITEYNFYWFVKYTVQGYIGSNIGECVATLIVLFIWPASL